MHWTFMQYSLLRIFVGLVLSRQLGIPEVQLKAVAGSRHGRFHWSAACRRQRRLCQLH